MHRDAPAVSQPTYRDFDWQNGAPLFCPLEQRDSVEPFVPTFSDIRFARINALKLRIAAGTYRVPTAALAERLMERMMLPN